MKTYSFTKDGATLEKRIDELKGTTKHIGDNIHTTLVGVTVHAILHGDVRLANRLDESVSNAFHKTGMRRWSIAKGPFTWDKGDKASGRKAGYVLDKDRIPALKTAIEANETTIVDGLISKTFWDFAPQKDFEGFDFKAKLAALIAMAKRTMTDDKKKDHPSNSFSGVVQAERLLAEIKDAPAPVTSTPAAPVAAAKAKKARKAKAVPVIENNAIIGEPATAAVN